MYFFPLSISLLLGSFKRWFQLVYISVAPAMFLHFIMQALDKFVSIHLPLLLTFNVLSDLRNIILSLLQSHNAF
jgi:hypothetical protein